MPAPWITAHARLFAVLGAPALDVRYVGGVVRNHLMGEPLGDIDIATPDVPEAVMERLRAAGIKAIPTGIDHGTITAVEGGVTYEITTLRRDTACDGRHAAVEFTTDWEEDARRRDFTINAMSLRPDGTLFDYHGGLKDAAAGRVRFVGQPADRIQEDYLRILRLFRFQARYGKVDVDGPTLAAVRAHVEGLAKLSAERIAQELAKLLAAPNPASAVALMVNTTVLAEILPEALPGTHFAQLIAHEAETAMPGDWLRRLAVLLPPETADAVARRLKLSNAEATRLAVLTAQDPVLAARITHLDLDRALYRLGASAVTDRLLIAWSRDGDRDNDRWRAQLARAAAWQDKTLPVSGADVLALGIAPGPKVGELLRTVEQWWIASSFVPTREEALARLRTEAKNS